MKILSWNVAGIRACLKKGGLDFLLSADYGKVCIQETKAEESQVQLSEEFKTAYPHRFWKSSGGVTQRKGLSGTAIWSKTAPIREISPPAFDTEGRITAVEFKNFNIVTVYTPNSQGPESDRFIYRVTEWDPQFRAYIVALKEAKNTIVCGDFNAVHKDVDMYNTAKYKNYAAGLLDEERREFQEHLDAGFIDAFRKTCKEPHQYTYWDQQRPIMRKKNYGWRIDYFLVDQKRASQIKDCGIMPDQMGSDHCPIWLDFNEKVKKKKKLRIVTEFSKK